MDQQSKYQKLLNKCLIEITTKVTFDDIKNELVTHGLANMDKIEQIECERGNTSQMSKLVFHLHKTDLKKTYWIFKGIISKLEYRENVISFMENVERTLGIVRPEGKELNNTIIRPVGKELCIIRPVDKELCIIRPLDK